MEKVPLILFLLCFLPCQASERGIVVDGSAKKKSIPDSPVGINLFMLYDDDGSMPRRFPMHKALRNLGVKSVRFNEGEYGDWYLFTHPDSLHLLTRPDAPLYPYLIDIKSRGIDAPLTDVEATPRYPGYPLNLEGFRRTVDFNDFIRICRMAGVTDPTVIIPTHPVDRSAAKDFYPSSDDMVKLAAGMVDYANNVMGAGIRFWEIGNEHYWEKNNDPEDTEYAAECAALALRMAVAMKSCDSSILVGVNCYKYKWVETLLNYSDENGRLADWIDNLIPHQYARKDDIGTYEMYLGSGEYGLHEIVEVLNALETCTVPDVSLRDRLKLQVTETSAFMAGEPAHLVRNCAWVALANFEHLMYVLLQPRVEYCHFWVTHWTDSEIYWSALNMDNSIAPMGWPVKLINDNIRDTVWRADLSDNTVRCYGSMDSRTGDVTLFLLNKSAGEMPVDIELTNILICADKGSVKELWADEPGDEIFRYFEGNTIPVEGQRMEIVLKPLSVTIIDLSLQDETPNY